MIERVVRVLANMLPMQSDRAIMRPSVDPA